MGKHRRTEDLNNKPYDKNADAQTKADEFDKQYNFNRSHTVSPAFDAYEKGKGKK